jgi:hypothetical protein
MSVTASQVRGKEKCEYLGFITSSCFELGSQSSRSERILELMDRKVDISKYVGSSRLSLSVLFFSVNTSARLVRQIH